MIDKKEKQEHQAGMQAKSDQEQKKVIANIQESKRVKSFEGTGATLTFDGAIILDHTTTSDFSNAVDYLVARISKYGITQFTDDLSETPQELVIELLEKAGEDYCQQIVDDVFKDKVL